MLLPMNGSFISRTESISQGLPTQDSPYDKWRLARRVSLRFRTHDVTSFECFPDVKQLTESIERYRCCDFPLVDGYYE
jgi:hypothetical protein